MSAARQDTIPVQCPGCGGKFQVDRALGGRRGRCARCGHTVEVPPPEYDPAVELFGVLCHLCDTPLYGTRDQIGTELRCPDCHARTTLREPPPKPKNTPAALEGEQYELWDDYNPASARSRPASAVPLIAVNCGLCDTLMYARSQQVGKQLRCPDCGHRTLVKPQPAQRPAKPVLTPQGQDYKVGPLEVLPTPSVLAPEIERRLLEEDEAGRGGSTHDTDRQRRAKRRRKLDARGRPILPRWPTITGVAPFLISPGVPARFFVFSALSIVLGPMALFCMALLFGADPGSAILGVFVLGAVVIIGLIVYSAVAATFVAIVVESSEGSDEVSGWPSANMPDWLPEALYLGVALAVAAVPGWGIARLSGAGTAIEVLAALGGMLLTFPIVFLSQLDASSPAAVLSPRILASWFRCPVTWTLMTIESALLLATCAGVFLAGVLVHPILLALAPPILVFAMLIYARILGRLAWAIAEATPAIEPPPSDDA